MAKETLAGYLKKLINTPNTKDTSKKTTPDDKVFRKLTMVTKTEFENIKNEFFTPKNDSRNNQTIIDPTMLNNHFGKIYGLISEAKLSYDKLITLEPKIEQAETIIIPSILSPNSLKNFDLHFTFSSIIDPLIDGNKEVTNLLLEKINQFVNYELKIKDKIEGWIREALFVSGAKPLLIVPPGVISNIRNSSISFEDYKESYDTDSLVISQEEIFSKITKDIADDSSNITAALEALSDEINPKLDKQKTSYEELKNYFTVISEEAKKSVEVTDKIESIGDGKKKEAIANKNFMTKYNEWYNNPNKHHQVKKDNLVSLGDYIIDDDKSETFNPMLLELPAESVIPIINKLSPTDPPEYIIMLDENGYPVTAISDKDQNMMNSENSQSKDLINKIYNSGSRGNIGNANTFFSTKISDDNTVLQKLYETYIDNLINTTAENAGFLNVDYELKSSVMQTMLFRLLKKKKTKMLFVPKFMLTYIAFKYNSYGVGVSKINDISFVLSLKLTYLISRLYKMVNQSIDHKEVKVALNDKINQPLEFLQALKDVLVRGKMMNFSHDPVKIVKTLADKHISIIPDNIPGIENFEISSDNKQAQTNMPDDSLGEILDNMLTILLEVPPSAYNELSENEYARSLTTINILFDLKIQKKRNTLTKHISEVIQNFFIFDTKFQEELKEILTQKLDSPKSVNNDLVLNIIKSIRLSLPESNISYDKAEFELAEEYISFVDTLVESIFPDKMVLDRDNQEFFENMTATIKSKLVKKYLSGSNLMTYFDKIFEDLGSFDVTDMLGNEEIITNYKQALDAYLSKVKKE